MPSFVEISPSVLEKIFEGFLPYMGMAAILVYDLDFLYTHWFPLPIDASYKIWLWLAKRFQRRRPLKLWTDDGRTPDHGHPISSPCEPNSSGELKMQNATWSFYRVFKAFSRRSLLLKRPMAFYDNNRK